MNKACFTVAVGLIAGSSLGAGFQLYTEGSAAVLGQAGAVSGRDDLTSLAWYNPSGLAGAERATVLVGSAFVSIRTDFSSESPVIPARDSQMTDDWRVVPHMYYVQPISEKWTALLSVNAPYGLITEWPSDWIGNAAAIKSDLESIYTTPTIAYRISDDLSVSLGVNVVYSSVELTASRDLTALGLPDFGVRKVEGHDYGFGYAVSGHWGMTEDWALGARYQSRVKLSFEGDARLDSNPAGVTEYDVEGDLTLPATVNFGVANTSFEKLTIGADVLWTEWSTYDELVFAFGAGYPLTNPDVVEKRWSDVWSFRLGGEYQWSESIALRAGYVWDQSPIDKDTLAPELPDADRQMLMVGLGWEFDPFGVDLAYSFLWADTVRSGDEINAGTGGATTGTYESTGHLFGMSGRYRF